MPSLSTAPTRLWLSSANFYPTYGGAQHRYRGYIPGLSARGLDVGILAGTAELHERTNVDIEAGWYDHEPGQWLPQAAIDGVTVNRMRLPDQGRSRLSTLYRGVNEVLSEPGQGPVVLQLLTGLKPEARIWLHRFKNRGAATVFSLSQYPNWHRKPWKRLFRQLGYRAVYNELDALVSNSPAIIEFLRSMGVTCRIEYIPNGVDMGRFYPSTSAEDISDVEQLRAELGIPSQARVIVSVGAIMARKGQDKLVKAWTRVLHNHPETHLLLIGPLADKKAGTRKSFGDRLETLIQASGRPSQVHRTGAVDDVERWLRASDICVLASNREGTPNSVLEAMATGLPCIVTPFRGQSDALGQAGEQFLCPERRPAALAEALGQLLANPGAAKALGERGRQFVLAHADQQDSLNRYSRLYADMAEISRQRVAAYPEHSMLLPDALESR